MEDKEELTSGHGVNRDGASEIFGGPQRAVPTSQFSGPTVAATDAAAAAAAATVTITAPTQLAGTVTPVSGAAATELKKKRGRPRKYNPDGTVSMALSPMPISSSIPLAGDYSGWKRGRGRARSADTNKKSFRIDFESAPAPIVPAAGNRMSYFVGANFTPYVLTVNPGEDVTMKIMSFAQQGSRAICILSANGTVSNVTLRQPTSCGGTLTYEGRFEILSLSGSFTPTENGGTKGRSGGMSVSLAGPDGRVMGGGLAGLLIAAGSVQVVVGSFLPGQQLESKPKKPRTELPPVTPAVLFSSIPGDEMRASYGMVRPVITPPPASFRGDNNSAPANPFADCRNFSADNKSSSAEDDSRDNSLSPSEVSG